MGKRLIVILRAAFMRDRRGVTVSNLTIQEVHCYVFIYLLETMKFY